MIPATFSAALPLARPVAWRETAPLGELPPLIDTGLVTLATQYQSEFAIHARAILGLPVDVALREPGASAVIYGGLEAKGIAFEGVAEALAVPGADLRLFGKPESFAKRRMGVALARGADTDQARARATEAAGKVRPVAG